MIWIWLKTWSIRPGPHCYQLVKFHRNLYIASSDIPLKFKNPVPRSGLWSGSSSKPNQFVLLPKFGSCQQLRVALSCWHEPDLVRFDPGSGSESWSWIRTWIQNCKADSARSNGQIVWITCESQKTAFNLGNDRDWDWLGSISWLTISYNDMLLAY